MEKKQENVSLDTGLNETLVKESNPSAIKQNNPKAKNFRALLRVAAPGALAAFVAACGKSMFGGSKTTAPKLTAKNDANKGDLGGGGSVKTVEVAEVPELPIASTDVVVEPCQITGGGIVEMPAEDTSSDFAFVAYGQRYSCMVVVKSKSGKIMEGDFVMLGEVLPNNKVRVIGRKRANSVDQAVKLIIFDGLNFGTNATDPMPNLVVLVNRETVSKRSVFWQLKIAKKISRPIVNDLSTREKMGAVGYDIVDFSTKNHDNYWNDSNLNISIEFGDPTNSVEYEPQYMQANDLGGNPSRKLKQAKLVTTTWPRPTGLPTVNYYVCDAFGDLIFSASLDYRSASFPMGNTNILQNHSTLLFYVFDGGMPDSGHYHRYFFHIG